MDATGFDKELNQAIDNYNKKFGNDAYSRVESLVDPLRPDGPITLAAINQLNMAVKTGIPLPDRSTPDNIVY